MVDVEDVEGCEGCYLDWLGGLGGGFWRWEILEEEWKGGF